MRCSNSSFLCRFKHLVTEPQRKLVLEHNIESRLGSYITSSSCHWLRVPLWLMSKWWSISLRAIGSKCFNNNGLGWHFFFSFSAVLEFCRGQLWVRGESRQGEVRPRWDFRAAHAQEVFRDHAEEQTEVSITFSCIQEVDCQTGSCEESGKQPMAAMVLITAVISARSAGGVGLGG